MKHSPEAPMLRRLTVLPALAGIVLAAAACAPADDDKTAAAPSASGSATAAACAKGSLALKTAAQLSIGTDKPAFEPWFKNDDPTNGQGFESAVAYAVADKLGFAKTEV